MIVLDSNSSITLEDVLAVSRGETVKLSPDTAELLDERRRQVVEFVERTKRPAYGFNRGFGSNVDVPVAEENLKELQLNLIRSHCSGMGEPVDRQVIRGVMFLRARSLTLGHSGVRSRLVQALLDLLNADIVPVVPRMGSVGASGDLAPLSHVALAVVGEGKVFAPGSHEKVEASQALQAAGLEPLELEMKEGLALNNGVQFSTALGIHALDRLETLLDTACLSTALSNQVLLGSDTPYLEALHELRPHPGAVKIARRLRDYMDDSPIRRSHERYDVDGVVQDPYSLRCAAQILGACCDLMDEARSTFEIEINSATDNPLLLPDQNGEYTRIISGGHFHGMPIAVKLYNLMEAMAIMARLSNMRCARFVDSARNRGLGHDLKWPDLSDEVKATSSAMMIPEYTHAALTNYVWGQTTPNHLFSLSTDAGQEDHVSMSAGLAIKVWDTLPYVARLLAIELAYGSQGAAIRKKQVYFPSKIHLNADEVARTQEARRNYLDEVEKLTCTHNFDATVTTQLMYHWTEKERRLSPVCEKAVDGIQQAFPVVREDRPLSEGLEALFQLVWSGELLHDVR